MWRRLPLKADSIILNDDIYGLHALLGNGMQPILLEKTVVSINLFVLSLVYLLPVIL